MRHRRPAQGQGRLRLRSSAGAASSEAPAALSLDQRLAVGREGSLPAHAQRRSWTTRAQRVEDHVAVIGDQQRLGGGERLAMRGPATAQGAPQPLHHHTVDLGKAPGGAGRSRPGGEVHHQLVDRRAASTIDDLDREDVAADRRFG